MLLANEKTDIEASSTRIRIFLKREIFSPPFSKKYASTQRIGIVFVRPFKNTKQWTYAFSVAVFTEYVWTVGQTGEKIYPSSNQNGYLWTGPNFHSLAVNC